MRCRNYEHVATIGTPRCGGTAAGLPCGDGTNSRYRARCLSVARHTQGGPLAQTVAVKPREQWPETRADVTATLLPESDASQPPSHNPHQTQKTPAPALQITLSHHCMQPTTLGDGSRTRTCSHGGGLSHGTGVARHRRSPGRPAPRVSARQHTLTQATCRQPARPSASASIIDAVRLHSAIPVSPPRQCRIPPTHTDRTPRHRHAPVGMPQLQERHGSRAIILRVGDFWGSVASARAPV